MPGQRTLSGERTASSCGEPLHPMPLHSSRRQWPRQMPCDRAPIARQAAPRHEPHYSLAIEHSGWKRDRTPGGDDAARRRFIDVIGGPGANAPIRELIERGLLRRTLSQRLLGQLARSDIARDLRGANIDAAGVQDRRDAQRDRYASALCLYGSDRMLALQRGPVGSSATDPEEPCKCFNKAAACWFEYNRGSRPLPKCGVEPSRIKDERNAPADKLPAYQTAVHVSQIEI